MLAAGQNIEANVVKICFWGSRRQTSHFVTLLTRQCFSVCFKTVRCADGNVFGKKKKKKHPQKVQITHAGPVGGSNEQDMQDNLFLGATNQSVITCV